MKLLIASDIHGAASWCSRLMDAIDAEQPDRVVLLGDLLYHGPRNDLPEDYAPKEVIAMLNGIADRVIAVRGNCEAEVDQMVLNFPCMADYDALWDPTAPNPQAAGTGRELFLTHGHVWGPGIHNSVDHMPTLPAGAAIVYGHTHKKVNLPSEANPGIWCFNPGSVGIPKDGSHSYGIYLDGTFEHRILG
ncbi:MAG: phosphodiesterase [Coriobacteriaceae bacterium]|nr:phosphodiesterase [Olsenella sp.]MCI1288633.1 phosphodiesterase [Olsenella sp.]RRF89483.1 MAG: phosphodiesterase [Coriobacteriaceae bacterium]